MIGLVIFQLWLPFSLMAEGQIEAFTTNADCDFGKMFDYRYWMVLGAIEGCTEFLPISSTGHLLIAEKLLDSSQAKFVKDEQDQEIVELANGKREKRTFKETLGHYFVIIQGGAFLAVFVLYWRFFYRMWKGLWGKDREGRILSRNIILAFIPAAVVGLAIGGWIHRHLFSMQIVAWGLIIGAVVMLIAERYKNKYAHKREMKKIKGLQELSWGESLLIGGMQCLALWPGMSRSMTTIVGGYFVGLSRQQAAEFSFLLGAVTLMAAAGYELFKEYHYLCLAFNYKHLLVGIIVAFVTASVTIRWFISYLQRHGLGLFAVYRIIVGIAILLFF